MIVRGMVTVICPAVEHVLLEVPVALFVESAGQWRWVIAVVEDTPVVVVLHDETLVDERKIEITGDDALTGGLNVGHTSRECI